MGTRGFYDAVLNSRVILAAAEQAGVARARLLADSGLDPATLADPLGRVPAAAQFRLLQHAAERTGDVTFGLRMARVWSRPGAMDLVGYAIASSGTFRDMIEVGYGLLERLSNLQRVRLEVSGRLARIVYRPAHTDWPAWRHLLAFYMANVVVQARLQVAPDFVPVEVRLPDAAPGPAVAYERLFKCPVRAGRGLPELVLAAHWLERPTRPADPELYALLARTLGERVAPTEPAEGMAARVRHCLRELLRSGQPPSLDTVAGALGLRRRTLQHHLRSAGTSYAELLDEVRRETALELLRFTALHLDEIAYQVGFASASALHRACRRWSGLSPAALRSAAAP